MVAQSPWGSDQSQSNVVGRWFRALDQRRIRVGHKDWLLHVTGIFLDRDEPADRDLLIFLLLHLFYSEN